VSPLVSSRVQLAWARSLLFVPGDRPDRFVTAESAGADAVVIDLEDAVAPAGKAAARAHALAWLKAGHAAVVRINAIGTAEHEEDVAAVLSQRCAVMVPKAEDAAELSALASRLNSGSRIIPLLETARGLLRAEQVCAVPGVVRVAFGHLDLAAELGVNPADERALLQARAGIVLASAAAGLAGPVDGITTRLRDKDTLRADALAAARLGFTGKLCIHPAQIGPAHEVFSPASADIEAARRIVGAGDGRPASAVDGEMVDAPVVTRARRLLERAASYGLLQSEAETPNMRTSHVHT
jgi:citrate lyase subunit beta / citryl-CoA lyase